MSFTSDQSAMGGRGNDAIRDLFITGARNAHALEKEALQLIDRQLDRLENYPMVADRLRMHRQETEQQEERLDRILESLDESRSWLKDTAMQVMGNLGALAHTPADDEILKNTFANLAFENYEIAAYKSLICMAEEGGFQDAASMLRQSLQEEEQMASWIKDHVEDVTERHVQLRLSGGKADR
jgi:ferritin-like metal-binding protein YciE